MIAGMQRDADDIEFQMIEIEEAGEKVPRFLKEKHKQITRQIEDLKAVDTDKD
jgi:septation ring formation regulator EzrA